MPPTDEELVKQKLVKLLTEEGVEVVIEILEEALEVNKALIDDVIKDDEDIVDLSLLLHHVSEPQYRSQVVARLKRILEGK